MPAWQIEAALERQPGIADCAVQAVNLEQGRVTVGVALVLRPGVAPQEAAAQVQAVMPLAGNTVVRLLVLGALPVLASGKVDRIGLLRLFQANG
ncbi:hypothetical protein HK414_10080 [Ramlibacter terrae]|uniref:AMP-binding enzyme C-terminal domain-containing protein n=1 Tax=Ramlibacter terrae TaxID=2732511 RepID=A0ABX6P223_9BURK|nr:hypothetical protein HK414_10080 [Ramlibacter terrae]